ncbi:hypothetical protein EZV62_024468 [Acer yangbiense]|uniref:Uncharacterized protein n=1 Tax=Acer yangbiense TaxID=1000413 RepID=A0A5C7GV74_9ROSI|nr:hypothetical protein EZV62_024468 [Acer yangbiense]
MFRTKNMPSASSLLATYASRRLMIGVVLKWRFIHPKAEKNHPNDMYPSRSERQLFELSYQKKQKGIVFDPYVSFHIEKAKAIKDEYRVLRMFTLNTSQYHGGGIRWDSINLEHPSTSKTLAMEPDLKNVVTDDLDRFVRQKDFYKRLGQHGNRVTCSMDLQELGNQAW